MTGIQGANDVARGEEGPTFLDRSRRGRVVVDGRSPDAMLQGILTNRVPDPGRELEAGVSMGVGCYSAVLTAKGRLVTDLRVLPLGHAPGDGYLLEVPREGMEPLLEHLARFLPPRLARVRDRSAETGVLTVLGATGAAWLSREVLGLRVDEELLASLPEEGFVRLDEEGEVLLVIRTGEVAVPAWDVVAEAGVVSALRARLQETGVQELSGDRWEALRVQAGRPAMGADMDGNTLLPETGLQERMVDHTKGCYTGQEVIVRIRDRGHVNRHLRWVLLGETPGAPGMELFREGVERPVGSLTSVASLPGVGGGLALGYVRREVEPPAPLRLGSPRGPHVEVRAVEAGGWGRRLDRP